MIVFTDYLWFNTKKHQEFIRITDEVAAIVKRSGVKEGTVLVSAMHITAGVDAVILDGDRVLLVKRANEPLKGEWSLPGGAVDVGETLEQAVARESKEETGFDVEVGPVVEVLDRIHRDASGRVEYHFVLVD